MQDLTPKVYLQTYGCQMNKLDSEVMLGLLAKEGYRCVGRPEEADVILYNTCSVREHAEDKVWSELGFLRALKKEHPEKILGITGCMAQNVKELVFKRAPHVDLVVGTGEEHRIAELIEGIRQGERQTLAVEIDHGRAPDPAVFQTTQRGSQVKAWVEIMAGCDQMCAYCVVPFTRGRERSRPARDILDEVKGLADRGFKEVTLLGQNVNAYGQDLGGEEDFAELLHQLNQRSAISRIRFLTSHPNNATSRLAQVMAEAERVCEHLHLPVQTGSDRILKLMNRGYTVDDYRSLVDEFRSAVPGISITTDLIVGFPTETEEEFAMTLDLVRELEFDSAFLFKYSPRKGTAAYWMRDDVEEEIKKRRHQEILALVQEISLRKHRAQEGSEVEILVERHARKGPQTWVGRARDFRKVVFRGEGSYLGRFVNVRITEGRVDHLLGTPQ
ncbi:MAG: tRNA (N6-isopentenyl adenosine(37)-C2)-methylthiotransferase MiaB [Candidatus Omnitrophica bacterium]|nr:tRNA (N6-isopentenyl adenosine(37)-C2)-methylthiotransferase MiaB [Candidatus Omnitrophota bacterium]